MVQQLKIVRHVRRDCAPESVRRQALALFKEGRGYKLVARRLGLSEHTVRDWGRLFKQGRFRAELSEKLLYYGPEMRELVFSLRGKGMSLRAIAARTGVSISTCCAWLKRRDLQPVQAGAADDRPEARSESGSEGGGRGGMRKRP